MENAMRGAVDELLQTYSETGGINYLDAAATLPSRLAVEDACAELMSLMFPASAANRSLARKIWPTPRARV